jgi:cytosine/adenosine deaminase-related metal-dependent hydrolase
MRWTALACKWMDRDANRGTARDVFNAATLDGARALGRDDIGRLELGAKADIVIVDFQQMEIGPVDDPIRNLVYSASASQIDTVIVDGRLVVEDGTVPGVDERALIRRASEAHIWQRDRFVAQHPRGATIDELFPKTYREIGGVKL